MKPYSIPAVAPALLMVICACSSIPDEPAEYATLRADPAGVVLVETLRQQGYPAWIDEGALSFVLRTRVRDASGMVNTMEDAVLDFAKDRIRVDGSRDGTVLMRRFDGTVYVETRDGVALEDAGALAAGRKALLRDHFFTILPFALTRLPCVMELLEPDTYKGVKHQVVRVYLQGQNPLFPAASIDCHFTGGTRRLERIFFQEPGGDYLWVEYDNFTRVDGVLVPLHRKFTRALDEKGRKKGPAHLEQWLKDVEFHGAADEKLFEK